MESIFIPCVFSKRGAETRPVAGIETPCITGGGTATLLQDLAAGTHTEVRW